MQFRWRRVKAIIGLQPLLGLLVALTWVTMLLLISEPEPPKTSGRLHRTRLGQRGPAGVRGNPGTIVYEPAGFDSEKPYEAKLTVPITFAKRYFGEAYPDWLLKEEAYGVTTAEGLRQP